jgi:hypothetical protein
MTKWKGLVIGSFPRGSRMPRAKQEWEAQMNTVSHWLRGPNLTLALIVLALVVALLLAEHVYDGPLPRRRNEN